MMLWLAFFGLFLFGLAILAYIADNWDVDAADARRRNHR